MGSLDRWEGPSYPDNVFLRKWQREAIIDVVVASGLDLPAFIVDDGNDQCQIRHPLTGSYFTISSAADNWWRLMPGVNAGGRKAPRRSFYAALTATA